ncbi:MAG TPA: hypothetical protein VL171_11425 [Verrucomicrobiae bacterium]|nr:hypothetical protein [Verrucomicrobiae bacterium]
MWTRVFAGFVVAFWVAMMAALVRVEIFPKPTVLGRCPTEQVLRKILANPNPNRLKIYRGKPIGESIGTCTIAIHPKLRGMDLGPGQEPDSYEITSDLRMRLPLYGVVFWFLSGKSTFNRQLELETFDVTMQTRRGGDSFRIVGDDAKKKVTVKLDLGDFTDERTFDYNEIQGLGLASGLGLPGLALGLSNGHREQPSTLQSGLRPTVVTCSYFDRLEIAGSPQRVYLIDSKIGDQFWLKLWVSEADGEVLKVSTSLGFEMVSELVKMGTSE